MCVFGRGRECGGLGGVEGGGCFWRGREWGGGRGVEGGGERVNMGVSVERGECEEGEFMCGEGWGRYFPVTRQE